MESDDQLLTIGELAGRAGVSTATLRFYEDEGLIVSTRTAGNQRRYPRSMLRRVAVVRAGRAVGMPLAQIRDGLAPLPLDRAPTKRQWESVARRWSADLDTRIGELVTLRDRLTGCVGCGCLSLRSCGLFNPGDRAAAAGPGARYLLGDDPPEAGG
jgi:MerR family redox-sensitive transcriptional activator SoxR